MDISKDIAGQIGSAVAGAVIGRAVITASGLTAAGMVGGGAGVGVAALTVGTVGGPVVLLAAYGVTKTAHHVAKDPAVQQRVRRARERAGDFVAGRNREND